MSDSQKWVLYLTSGYDSLHRDNLLVIHTPIFETKPVEQLRGRATRIVRHMDELLFPKPDNSGNEKIDNN